MPTPLVNRKSADHVCECLHAHRCDETHHVFSALQSSFDVTTSDSADRLDALYAFALGTPFALGWLFIKSLALDVLGETFFLTHLLEAAHHLFDALAAARFDTNRHVDTCPLAAMQGAACVW